MVTVLSSPVWADEIKTPNKKRAEIPLIHSQGVGKVFLGKRIPKEYLTRKNLRKKWYFADHIADGVLFEGLSLKKPRASIGIENGPYSKSSGKSGKSSNALDVLKKKALKSARLGAKVSKILIDEPTLKTAEGIGVGNTLQEIKKKYTGVKLHRVPPTLGKDRCSVWVPLLKHVYFHFADCKKAENGAKVVHIFLFK